jgi:hypothetical protein
VRRAGKHEIVSSMVWQEPKTVAHAERMQQELKGEEQERHLARRFKVASVRASERAEEACTPDTLPLPALRGGSSPSHDGRGPAEPSAKASHGKHLSRLDVASTHRFVQRQRNRGRRGVAVLSQVGHHPLCRVTQAKAAKRRAYQALPACTSQETSGTASKEAATTGLL